MIIIQKIEMILPGSVHLLMIFPSGPALEYGQSIPVEAVLRTDVSYDPPGSSARGERYDTALSSFVPLGASHVPRVQPCLICEVYLLSLPSASCQATEVSVKKNKLDK